jgi:uncharacterized protein YjbJ (UPF0337 family)
MLLHPTNTDPEGRVANGGQREKEGKKMATGEDRQEGVKGAVEELKGRTKEAVGTLFGHDSTQREGRAQ